MDEQHALIQAFLDLEVQGGMVIFYRELETALRLLDELERLPSLPSILSLCVQRRRGANVGGDTG